MRKNVRECLTYIRSITDFVPKAALVLGSGLGGFTEKLDSIVCEIPYSDIPGFPVSTVSGHAGKFIMGYVEGVPLICMSGRVHYYEGYAPEDVVLPLRVMHALGAEFLFLTNAAGGISSDLKPGSLVLLPKLRELVEKAASEADVRLESGVYCQLSGPSYETPAEIRLLQRLGADVVGMSTVMEAITAHHAGMKVCAISFVSNMAAGINTHALSHEEVKEAGIQAAPRFTRLVRAAIATVKSYEAE